MPRQRPAVGKRATAAGRRETAAPSSAGRGGASQGEAANQAEVIAFLGNPASYPGQPGPVERLETHGALVFLAGAEAWKIKRAVRFPYMDFSTLERRRAACLREMEVNRRLAPEIYLEAAPITRTGGGELQLGGRGEIVEWAVHMRRFDQADLLSRVAEAGPMAPELTLRLADAVYASHAGAEPGGREGGAGRIARLLGSVSATLAGLCDALDPAAVRRFTEAAESALARSAALLDRRAAAGCVRRCHGDLHLGNIVLWRGRPTLFDAIEFDEELATIDTLYDLAFLLMDLDRCGQRPAANAVLNRYLWRSGADLDLDGLAALPLFLGLRAAIRAFVTAERAAQEEGGASARDRGKASLLLNEAGAYLVPPAPRLVAIGGLSGTGKSTLGRALAPDLGPAPGAVHLRSDLERKRLGGVSETTRLGPDAYTQAASDEVYAVLRAKARRVLAAGHAAIVDAVLDRPEQRAAVEALAHELRIPFRGLWLEAPSDDLVHRVETRTGDASDATGTVVRLQLARDTGALTPAWRRIDAGGSAEATLEQARAALARS
jgi:aminoglycoside phosphotransferase family enzyme/predicted kinase